jgi:hypothetical protein
MVVAEIAKWILDQDPRTSVSWAKHATWSPRAALVCMNAPRTTLTRKQRQSGKSCTSSSRLAATNQTGPSGGLELFFGKGLTSENK